MTTIYDIAKYCEISAATVSYVLNGHSEKRRISLSTQDKVWKAAHELGYERARAVRSNAPVIAIYWLQKHLEMVMPSLIGGLNAAMSKEISPADVIIRPYEQGHISGQVTLWDPRSCDVAIIVGADSDDLAWIEQNPTKVKTILLNRELPGYSSVSIDHEEAGILAAQHAILKGGSSLALVLNPSALFGLSYRGKAILQTCQDKGIDMRSCLFYCGNGIDNGYELGWEMVRKKQLKKVIICIYDMVALGIIRALNEAGIAIGDEVQVIATSSGPSRLFARTTPPLTVVNLKIEDISERCIKMAIDLATNRLSMPQKVIVHPSIIYRESCPMGDFPQPLL